jgi:PGF-pre-PGF domain-containing protein
MDKKYGLLIICTAILFLCLAGTVSAKTWYVDDDGGADFTRIQDAIAAASDLDTIIVSDGTYTENIDVTKRLTIKSEKGTVNCILHAANPRVHVFAVTVGYVNISGFTVEGAYDNCGIHISDVNNCTISNNFVSGNYRGIYLSNSNRNIIANNTAKNNGNNGFYLEDSNNNEIRNNIAISNHNGGIELWASRENIIANNTAKNNGNNGVYLSYSKNNKLTGNIMSENGIIVRGDSLSYFLHEIDESNTVNGKPVYYWKKVEGGKVPEGAGQVILVNCSNVIVENQNLNDASDGIEVAFSFHISIKGNNCTNNNGAGIYIHYSSNNNITGNNCSYNKEGIKLYSSSNYNTLVNNTVSSNNDHGIYVSTSNFNIIAENTIADNDDRAICLCYESNYNRIENNTISNNAGGVSIGYYNNPSSHNIISDNVITGTKQYGAISIYGNASTNNTILHNTVLNNTIDGIHLGNTRYNIVKNNTALNNSYGIYLLQSTKNIIENNTALYNYGGVSGGGITLDSSNNNTINNNIASNNSYNGICLSSSINNSIGNNIASNNSYGIYLSSSLNNSIKNNIANSNDITGIFLYDSSTNNRIAGNYASSNNRAGITLGSLCSNNTIKNNNARFNEYFGMILFSSDYNRITGNYVCSNNGAGISIGSLCSNNTIKNNNASHNKYFGIMLVSNNYNTVTNNDLFSNLYGLFLMDLRYPNNIINNNASNNNLFGIFVDNSNSQAISNNMANSNEKGIGLQESSEIKLINNVANLNNISGFSLINSTNNTLLNNSASRNTYEGIFLSNSNTNTISTNNVSSNYFGISLSSSNDNNITDNSAESNYYFEVLLHSSSGNEIVNNTWYIQEDIVYGVSLHVTPSLQTVENGTNASYYIVVENLGNSPDTFDLVLSSTDNPEISSLDTDSIFLGAREMSINTTTTEVEIPQTKVKLLKPSVKTITMNVRDTATGIYTVKVEIISRHDNTVKDIIETRTIVPGQVDSVLINSPKITKSAIINSSINHSVIDTSAVMNSSISGSTITCSVITNSEVVNASLNDVILENAKVSSKTIFRGNITINEIKYEISNGTRISDLIIGSDHRDSNLVGIMNKTLEINATNSNTRFNISARKDYFAGSMSVQKSSVPPNEDIPISGINHMENYVWGNISHFSVYALVAQPPAPSGPKTALSGRGGRIRHLPEEITLLIANLGINIFNFEWLGHDITKISIDLKSMKINAKVALKKVDKPAEFPDPPGIVYGYFDISTNIEPEKIRASKIHFKIIKSWTVFNDVNAETIKLWRYANGWGELETAKIKEDDNYLHFCAETKCFSLIAITSEKRTLDVRPTAPTPTPTPPSESPVPSPPVDRAPISLTGRLIIIVAIVASAISVSVTYLVLRRRKT